MSKRKKKNKEIVLWAIIGFGLLGAFVLLTLSS